MRKATTAIIMSAALFMLLFSAGCGGGTPEDIQETPPFPKLEIISIGTGSNSFTLDITDDKYETVRYEVSTDETTVGAALLELNMIGGEQSDIGLLITYVNGLRADYAIDKAYWAFFIDGEYAMYGADATQIEQGKVYAFAYTPA